MADFMINLIYETVKGESVHNSDAPDAKGAQVLCFEYRVHDLRTPWEQQQPFEAWLDVKLKDPAGKVIEERPLGPKNTFNQPPLIANRWLFRDDKPPPALQGSIEVAFRKVTTPGQRGADDPVLEAHEKWLGHKLEPTSAATGQPAEKKVPDLKPTPRVYATIQDVLDAQSDPDPEVQREVRRRLAVLYSAAKWFPAFNYWPVKEGEPARAPAYKKGAPSNFPGNGPWVFSYMFDGKSTTNGTSCTTVNPGVNWWGLCVNKDPTKPRCPKKKDCWSNWGFNGPKNKGWIPASEGKLPSVGDTYLLMNGPSNGHVGHILQVPAGGNGLWITGDGGQGDKKGKMEQTAYIVPRWGVMASHLPPDGGGKYPGLPAAGEDRGVYLGGYGPADSDPSAPIPADGDGPATARRLTYRGPSTGPTDLPKPRWMPGFVHLGHKALAFDVDDDPKLLPADFQAELEKLQGKVKAVGEYFRGGKTAEGVAT